MKELTNEWLQKAEGDYRSARKLFYTAEPEFDAVCFHAQQCVEKYLKSILQENDIYFEKIRNLNILLSECKDIIPELVTLKGEIAELMAYAVEVRYPGINTTREDAEKSVFIME